MPQTPTPHIAAAPGDFAPTVLMPGDPKRAAFIAKHYLTGARLVNDVRGVQGYTGLYAGKPVSVMASGMGMPSMGIYSYELFHFYGVRRILRIGSAGAIHPQVRVRDLVFGMGACTNGAYGEQFGLRGAFAPIADYTLLETAVAQAREMGVRWHVGNLLSSDTFYDDDPAANEKWQKLGVLAIEMEAAALYMNAARAGAQALALCTVSDHLLTGEATTAAERETSFTDMMEVALRTAAAFED